MTIETAVMQQSEAKRWATVAIVIGCGIGAALQVGKVPIAASMLQQSLGIDLATVGTIAGIFAVLGLVGSVPAGVVIARGDQRPRLIAPEVASRTGPARAGLMQEATALARRRTPALLMVLFALYSLMFFALFSFLPILLTERLGVSSQGAGALSALAAAGNVVGNLAAGHLLARGVSRNLLIAVAAFAMGASALGIFLPVLGGWGAFWLCLLFSAIGGLIPATLLATAPAAARSAAMVPVMMGLLMTGSNFGQVTGPIAVGAVVSASGWGAACVMVVAAAILAGLAAWMLARCDHKRVSEATDPA